MKTFGDIENYLKSRDLKNEDFRVYENINTVEFNKGEDHEYFISVGEWENGTFEVFAHSVGAEWQDDFCVKDGELVQYKIYKSLKKALDFALKCRKQGKLPDAYIVKW